MWALVAAGALAAAATANEGPRVAVILDDIGYRQVEDLGALTLAPEIAFAVIPGSSHGRQIGAAAARQGREVLVHLPMAALGASDHHLGPHGLGREADEWAVRRAVAAARRELPFASGLNNHMGSHLTGQHEPMRWLMESLRCTRDLYFVDSYTTAESVALTAALAHAIPALRRDVFLDNDPAPPAVAAELERLLRLAEERGHALAIAHPHPATLDVLYALPQLLQQRGIRLVRPSELLHSTAVVAGAD